jgi:predicted transposase YdaD
LKFEKNLIRQFLSEDIMQESVIYQDILQKGKQQEALTFCMSLLDERFGEIDSSIIERVQVLNKEQLEALGRALLRILSIPDLVTWLDQQESN